MYSTSVGLILKGYEELDATWFESFQYDENEKVKESLAEGRHIGEIHRRPYQDSSDFRVGKL